MCASSPSCSLKSSLWSPGLGWGLLGMGHWGTKIQALCSRKCGGQVCHRPFARHLVQPARSPRGLSQKLWLASPLLRRSWVLQSRRLTGTERGTQERRFWAKLTPDWLGYSAGSSLGHLSSLRFFWALGAEGALLAHAGPAEHLTPSGGRDTPASGPPAEAGQSKDAQSRSWAQSLCTYVRPTLAVASCHPCVPLSQTLKI